MTTQTENRVAPGTDPAAAPARAAVLAVFPAAVALTSLLGLAAED